MKTQKIEYTSGQTKCIGYLAWDETQSGQRPGIVLFSEAFGLNEHARQHAERLAQLGYVALAADIHGDGMVYADMPSLVPAMQALYADRAGWRARARAAFDTLIAQPQVDGQRTAAIGFCFGGATCLELARSGAPLAAVVTFHAGLIPEQPGDAGRIRGSVLMCHGAEDRVVKQEALDAVIAEFKRDKVDWQFCSYGNAVHSFTDVEADQRGTPGFAFNKQAAERSWAAMRQLFDAAFV